MKCLELTVSSPLVGPGFPSTKLPDLPKQYKDIYVTAYKDYYN